MKEKYTLKSITQKFINSVVGFRNSQISLISCNLTVDLFKILMRENEVFREIYL